MEKELNKQSHNNKNSEREIRVIWHGSAQQPAKQLLHYTTGYTPPAQLTHNIAEENISLHFCGKTDGELC